MAKQKIYAAIDLKSFYASVECVERGLDPLNVNLVVADRSRTEKTICLAVSPSLKAHKISGRARLFEVIQRVKEVNQERLYRSPNHQFTGKSFYADELSRDPELELDFIAAPPRMAKYIEVSSQIYDIYLKYVAPEDMHVYSIDEVFLDLTGYLETYKMSAHELTMTIIRDVLVNTGITATAGIGTNMYLAKVAMDIVAKHIPADADGVRIAEIDERKYRELLWTHEPLTDFWRVGKGIAKKLNDHDIYTMGDIARCSIGKKTDYYNEELLYKLFGINAELLIDHAWGWEPTEISAIQSYRPESNSVGHGQVLSEPYSNKKGRIIAMEMADNLSMDLLSKGLVTNQIVLTIGYDAVNLQNSDIAGGYTGEVKTDFYGRMVPKYAHGTENIDRWTSSTKLVTDAVLRLYDRITDKNLFIRRLNITASRVLTEDNAKKEQAVMQTDLFSMFTDDGEKEEELQRKLEKEKRMQQAILSVKNRYGKNAILKGTNLREGATSIARNGTIGGHKAE